MSLDLMLLTADAAFAKEVEDAGIDRVFYDLEYLEKRDRQRGRNTVISENDVEGIPAVREVLSRSELLVRTNPINPYLKEKIDLVIEYGADVLMLPMAMDAEDAQLFVDMVAGRAKTCVMIETPQAFCRLSDICEVEGIDEFFIGLNDLHIGMGLTFMFEVLSGGLIDHMARKMSDAGIPFGFGGIARIGEGLLPADNILGEHYRLGSHSVILSRTFTNHPDLGRGGARIALADEVAKVRECEERVSGWTSAEFEANRQCVCDITREIVSSIHAKLRAK